MVHCARSLRAYVTAFEGMREIVVSVSRSPAVTSSERYALEAMLELADLGYNHVERLQAQSQRLLELEATGEVIKRKMMFWSRLNIAMVVLLGLACITTCSHGC